MNIKLHNIRIFLPVLLAVFSIISSDINAQTCTGGTPFFKVDLTGHPDSLWISSSVVRNGNCCQGSGKNNDPCIEFLLTLDENTQAIKFFVAEGAKPSGALDWQLNCGTKYPVDVEICISGKGPHKITFCKPGNNQNKYGIQAISKPKITPPSVATNLCEGKLSVDNFDKTTIQWNTVFPGTKGQYNSALSCTSGCDSVTVDFISGISYIDVEVSGKPVGGCSSSLATVTSRVYFVDTKRVNIYPKNPSICFGGTYAQLTATGSGGAAPYTYKWSNGATGPIINAPSIGWYVVTMWDTTACEPVKDSVYVTAFKSPILSNAGKDDTTCANNSVLQLNGTVQVATKGRWSGGTGTYSPNDSTLNATYTPTAAEITAGKVRHILTTIDNGSCPAVKDTLFQIISKTPVVNAGNDTTVCANNSKINLKGTVQNATGGSWSGGTGTYFPNNTSLSTSYTPSATELLNKTATLTLTSTGNGKCLAVTDAMTVTITSPPTIEAGPDQTVCANNAAVQLNASYTIATGISWSGGTGSFSSKTIVNPVYTPSAADKAAGKVVLRAVTTGSNKCIEVTDSLTIFITPAPTANAGVDLTVCENAPDVTLNGSVTIATGGEWITGSGTFGNKLSLTSTYKPSAAEITAKTVNLVLRTTGNSNCLPVTDTMKITITPAPVVNAGPDVTVCGNKSSVSLNGSVTVTNSGQWNGGTGNFSSRTTLAATYNPSAAEITAGSSKLWLTSANNGKCTPVTDTILIKITPAPTVSSGPAQSVCENNSQIQLAGSFTVATGADWSGGTGAFSTSKSDPVAKYTPSAAELTNKSVTLTYTTTGNGNCNPVSSSTTFTFTPSPTVNAGQDFSVCANNPAAKLQGSVTIATKGKWTGGTGTFAPDDNTLTATYTPSAAEITAGKATLTLTTTDNGNCLAVSDQVVITITKAPVVDAGPDQTVCSNNPSITLAGTVTVATGGSWSGGTGTLGSATSLNSTYSPSAAEIASGFADLTLTSSGNNGCVAVTDKMHITITKAPVVNAGPDQIVCANNAGVKLAGSVTIATGGTWSQGNGKFSTSANDLAAVYTPSATEIAAGTVTLRLTTTGNGNCLAVFDDMKVTVTQAPTVYAGADRTVCGNNATLTLDGRVTVATGGKWSGGTGTYSPSDSALTGTYTPSAAEITAGKANLRLTTTGNGKCLAAVDSMLIITINLAPNVNAGPDASSCSNNPVISLSGTVTRATGGQWSGGAGTYNSGSTSLSTNYIPTAAEISAGSVTFTLASTGNGLCKQETDQVKYTFTPAPTVNAGNDISTCSNNPVVNLSATYTVAGGVKWSGGNGVFSNAASAATTYTPTAAEINNGFVLLTATTTSNLNCNAVSDQIKISFTPAPTSDAGADRTVCSNNPVISLAGSVTVAPGGSWTGGTGTFSNRNSLTPAYTPSAAEITAKKVNLYLTTTAVSNCIPVTDTMTITITPAPTVSLGNDKFVCGNNPSVDLNAVVTVASGGKWITGTGTFLPDRNTLNPQYTPSATEITSGSSLLIMETTGNGNCLPAKDTLLIVISAAPVSKAGKDTVSCKNNAAITLYGTTQNATGRIWSGGAGTFSPNANTLNAVYTPTANELNAGQVTLVLTASRATCTSVTDDIVIKFTPTPTTDAGPDQTICSNNPKINLNGSVTVAKGGSWSGGQGSWSPSATSLSAVYTPTQSEITAGKLKLVLTGTGNGNCLPVSDTMVVTFTPAPVALPGAPQSVCANKSTVSLNGNVQVSTGGIWSGGNGGTFTPNNADLKATYNPSATDKQNGFTWLKLTTTGNGNCLAVTDSMKITITTSPNANAGEDFDICANNPKAQLNGIVTVANGGSWTGGNGILTPSADSLTAVYTPTAAEIIAGKVTLTLITTGNGNCNLVTDNITITITPAPTVNAGPDQIVCGKTTGVQLNGTVTTATGGKWATGGSGTFSPDANALNAVYIPSLADIAAGSVNLTFTSTGNGKCIAVSDGLIVTFTPAPSIDAGPDQTVCTNGFPVILSATGSPSTWQGGNGTFSPGRNTLNPKYTPTQAEINQGFVLLDVVTNPSGACPSVSDQVKINLKNGPVVNAGADITVCGDVTSVKLNGSVLNATGGIWTTTGKGSFKTSATTLPGEYIAHKDDINAGPVRFVLTSTGNGLCTAEADTMYVTFTAPPTITVGSDRTICADKKTIDLIGQVTVATGAVWTTNGKGTFSDPELLNTIYTFASEDTAAKTVTFTLTSTGNGTCIPVSASMKVSITPAPVAKAGNDITICADSSQVALSGKVFTATGGVWTSDGSGTFSPNNASLNTSYFPTPADTAKKSLRFILTTTGNGTCNAVTDTLFIKINPAPVANAGVDQIMCADKKQITLAGKVTNATGGTWTSTGSGSFSNTSALNAVYTLSSGDSTAAFVTLTLKTTGVGTCKPVQDQMTISLTPAPSVNAGADQVVCANNPTAKLNGKVTIATGGTWSNGTGTYTPHPNSLSATYKPSAAEITAGKATLILSTTGNGSCNQVKDTVTITITPSPLVNPGPDQTVCGDIDEIPLKGTVTNATGGLWATTGSGYFTPSEYDLNAKYVPSVQDTAAKSVTLTLTSQGNGNCLAVTNSMILSLTPAPTVDAGSDVTVCGNNAAVTLAGKVTVATGGIWSGGTGTFNPSASSLNTVYTPSAAEITHGSVTLTLTTTGMGSCKAVSAKKTIIITPAPVVNAGTDINVCENNPVTALNGSVTVATGGIWSGNKGGVFSPSETALKPAYILGGSEITGKSATLILTSTGNGNCKPVSDTLKINVTPAPVTDAGPDLTICGDSAQITLAGNVTGAAGLIWTTTGTGNIVPAPDIAKAGYIPSSGDKTAGKVKMILTSDGNGNCRAVTDSMFIYITPAPAVNAGSDVTVCSNNSDVQLNGIVTVSSGGKWTGGTGTFIPDANSLAAVYKPSAAEVSTGSVTLTLETTGNGNCKKITDKINILITPSPIVSAGQNKSVCENNPVVFLGGTVTVAQSGVWVGGKGQWSGGDGTYSPSTSLGALTYTLAPSEVADKKVNLILTSIDNGLCKAETDTVTITVTPSPTADAGADVTICADSSVVNLSGTVTVAGGGVWSANGSGTFTPNANQLATTYVPSPTDRLNGQVELTLTTQQNANCLAVTDTKILTITPAPVVNAGEDQVICADASAVNLNGSVSVATGGIWSGGTGTFNPNTNLSTKYIPTATEISNGAVTLFLTSTGNGSCKAVKDAINIKITPAPTVNAGFDQVVCADAGGVSLNGKVTIATGGIWNTSGTGTFIPGTDNVSVTYIPSPADTTLKSVKLVLTTTGNGTCLPKKDTTEVKFTPVPVVEAGADKTICADAGSIELKDASVFNATGGKWSSDGDGTFTPNANTVNAIYTPSATDIAKGNITLTLTSATGGICMPVADKVKITINPAPVANAGVNDTICANTPQVKLNGSVTVTGTGTWTTGSGLGSFSSVTDLHATFTADPAQVNAGIATIILTSTNNGLCKPVTSKKFIIFKPVPVIDAGPNQTICEDLASIKLNATVSNSTGGNWVTSGTGTFSDNKILNPVYTLSAEDKAAGQITLRISSTGNGFCSSQKDSMFIKINPAPTVDAGPAAICSDAAGIKLDAKYTNAGGVTWTTSGTGTFSPSANMVNPTFSPTAADVTSGQVILRLTTTGNGPCKAVRDSVILSITPVPSADAGIDQIVCANAGDVQLNGKVIGSAGGTWTSSGNGAFTPSANALNAKYTPSAIDIINGKVTLKLTTIGVGLCNPASDNMVITVTPAPTSNPGAPQTVCADTAGITLKGKVTIATGGTWSSSTGGTFAPSANDLNAVYKPSAADITNGKVTLTLTTTGNGNCKPVSNTVDMTITPAPTADLGPDQTICGDINQIILNGKTTVASGRKWGSSGNGAFTPDSSSQFITYNITSADTAKHSVKVYFRTTGNGMCKPVSDTAKITITPAPRVMVTAGGICADKDTIQVNGKVWIAGGVSWSTSGTGAWDPDSLNLNPKYVPSAADKISKTVTLTITTTNNGTCNPVKDSIVINISPAPIADAGAPITICAENNGVNLNGSVQNAGGLIWKSLGSGSFSNENTGNAIYTASQADTAAHSVKLVLATTGTGSCATVTDTVLVSFTPAPVVDAGPAIICSNTGIANLSGRVYNATGLVWSSNGDGSFSDPLNNPSNIYTYGVNDNATKNVTILLTSTGNGICAAKTDQVVINMADAPVADAGGPDTICADVKAHTLNGSQVNAGGLVWSTLGSGTFTNPTSSNALYHPSNGDTTAHKVKLVLTTTNNGLCAAVTDTLVIQILPKPVADAGPASVCSNNPTVNLQGTIQHAGGAVWSKSAGADGVFGNPSSLITTYTPGAADIASKKVTLYLTSADMGSCNPVTDSLVLFITEPPTPVAGAPAYICADEKFIQLNGTISGAATGGVWKALSNGKISDSTDLKAAYAITVNDTTARKVKFVLTTTGNGNCKAVTDTTEVLINPAPVVNAGSDQKVCGDVPSVTLSGKVFNAGGAGWTSSGTGTFQPDTTTLAATYKPSQADTAAGNVVLKLTTTLNDRCTAVSDSMVLTIDRIPYVDAGPSDICADDPGIELNAVVYNATGVTWSTNGDGSFAPNSDQDSVIYIVSANDAVNKKVTLTITTTGNGACAAATDKIDVNLVAPPVITAGSDQVLCADGNIKLTGQFSGATGVSWTSNGTGTWSPDKLSQNTVYSPSSAEAKTVTDLTLWFAVTTTGTTPCAPVTDTTFVTFTPAPVAVVNAGNDTTVCADKPNISLKGSISVAQGGEWTSSGNGIFTPNAFSLEAVYMPDSTDIKSGSIKIALSTTGNGMCNPVTDTMVVSFTTRPAADAGPDETICEDMGSIQLGGKVTVATGGLWYSSGSGSFDDDSLLTAVYTVSPGDIADSIIILTMQTTGNGACEAAFDNKTLYVRPAPVPEAGFDRIICADNRVMTLEGKLKYSDVSSWSTSGTGAFTPHRDSLKTDYTVTDADTTAGLIKFWLSTPAGNGCLAKTDTMFVSITDAPAADPGSPQTVCADVEGVNISGKVTVGSGGMWSTSGTGYFAPNAVSLDAVYIPSSEDTTSGKVTISLETTGTGDCDPVTETTEITILPVPVTDAGQDIEVCANAPEAQLSGIIYNAAGGIWTGGKGSFKTSDTDLKAIYIPSADEIDAGVANLTLTSTGMGTCNPVSDRVTIIITPAPVADAGPDQTICANNPHINISGVVSVATGGVWTGGNGTYNPGDSSLTLSYLPSAAEISSKSLELVLTTTGNGKCKSVSDTMKVTFTDAPTATAPPLTTICADRDTISLTGIVTIASGGSWSTSGSGTFSSLAENLNTVYSPSPSDKLAGTVKLVLTTTGNGNCLPASDTTELIITPTPTADAGENQIACSNNPVVTLKGNVTVAAGGTWSGGLGTFNKHKDSLTVAYTPASAEIAQGFMTMTLTTTGNGTCNAVKDVVNIMFTDSPVVYAGTDQNVCANNPVVQLSGSVTVSAGGIWTGGTGSFESDPSLLDIKYTPSQNEINAGFVKLALTSTGNGGCLAVTDSVKINITPAPVADAAADQTICADKNAVILNGKVQVAGGGEWTTAGSGIFTPDPFALNATYELSEQDKTADSVKIYITTTANGKCIPVKDSMMVYVTPKPQITAGNDQIVCGNNSLVNLSGTVTGSAGGQWTGGSGTYPGGSDKLVTTYLPSPSEIADGFVTLTFTSTGNGMCNEVTDQVNIEITPSPEADAGSDRAVCFNKSDAVLTGIVKVAGGGKWSGGSGYFTPSPTSLTTTYTPTDAEKAAAGLTMTLTTTDNGTCLPAMDQMAVIVNPAPVVDAGPSQTVCADVDSVILAGKVTIAKGGTWTTSGTGSFVPNANVLNARYIPSDADRKNGNLSLTLTSTGNANCVPVSSFMLLKITPAPVVNAGPDMTTCADSRAVQLSGKVTVATGGTWSTTGGGSFTNANNLNSVYNLSDLDIANKKVIIKLKSTGNGKCKEVTDNVEITITPAPQIDAGINQTICADAGTIRLNGTVTVSSGATWKSSGTGTFSNANDLKSEYTLSPKDTADHNVKFWLTSTGNGLCNAITDSVAIQVRPAPIVSTGDGRVCADLSGTTVKGVVYNASGVKWTTSGTGSFAPNAYTPVIGYTPSQQDISKGFVTLTLSSEGHGTCKPAVTEMRVIITPLPDADAGEDRIICRGSNTILVSKPVQDASYAWYTMGGANIGNEGSLLITAKRDTSFVLQVTDTKGCSTLDTVKVNVADPPEMQIITPHYCYSEGLNIEAVMPVIPAEGGFQWYRNDTLLYGETSTRITVTQPGQHIIGYSFGYCSVYDTTSVTALPTGTGEDMVICIGDSVYLKTTFLEKATYQWYLNNQAVGDRKYTHRVMATDLSEKIYTVQITDSLGCKGMDTVSVSGIKKPDTDVLPVQSCIGNVVTLEGPEAVEGVPYSYRWYRSDSLIGVDRTQSVVSDGYYRLYFKVGNCVTTDSGFAKFNPLPVPDNQDTVKYCSAMETVATLDAGPGAAYNWLESGSVRKDTIVNTEGYHYVEIFNEFGCSVTDSIYSQSTCPPRIFVPEAFAPDCNPSVNNCAADRTFKIYGIEFVNFSITIFNRWGEIIFWSDDPKKGWDGTYLGEPMPSGVYPYIIRFTSANDEFNIGVNRMEGSVVLIR